MEYPRRLGKYEILDKIGAGGMAEVFRARRIGASGSDSLFAIKLLEQTLAPNPRMVSMFVDEARLAAQLHHPSIVNLIEFGTNDSGTPFMVMEYIDGQDLRWCLATAAIAEYWLPIEFSLCIVRSICSALQYAHQARSLEGLPLNIIHRDVSHSNIFLAQSGRAMLADFGIAKADGQRDKTKTGLVKGKLGYLSPEQVRAETLDGRSDVFAVAVVLWELITQRRMFAEVSEFKTMIAVCTDEREPPSRYRHEIPAELDALILKGVEISKSNRYSTAEAFGAAIDDFAERQGYNLSESFVAKVLQYLVSCENASDRPLLMNTPILENSEIEHDNETPLPLLERYQTNSTRELVIPIEAEPPSDNFFTIDWMQPMTQEEADADLETTRLDVVSLLDSRTKNTPAAAEAPPPLPKLKK